MVDDIRSASTLNNIRCDITGLLVADNEFFVQVLEGERQSVSDTFLRIGQDYPHNSVAILSVTDNSERLFPAWSMAALSASEARSRLLAKYRKAAHFDPHQLHAAEALRLVDEISRSFHSRQLVQARSVVYVA